MSRPESPASTIGDRLRALLTDRHGAIREFSDATGIPYRTVQEYLASNNKPGADHLARMALAGADVHYLLTGRTPPTSFRFEKGAPDRAGTTTSDNLSLIPDPQLD
jgi:hypothetical protein